MHRILSPLDLPELLNLISKFIDRRYAITCATVSKSWSHVFLPQLWKEVCFNNEKFIPEETTLSKYAHLIVDMRMKGDVPLYISETHFPSLKKLFLTGSYTSKFQFSAHFLSINPSIEDFSIQHYVTVPNYPMFYESISNLSRLTRLYIASHTVPPESAATFWDTICRMESVRLINVTYPDSLLNLSAVPHKLASVEAGGWREQKQVEVIEKCTAMEYLKWEASTGVVRLVNNFKQGTWPNLHRVGLFHVRLESEQLVQIINSISRLTAFSVDRSTWDYESFIALSYHFDSLESLENSEVPSFTSVMVNTVMCSCPNLKELTAVMIEGVDIINNALIGPQQPCSGWICTQLRTLVIRFNLQGLDSQIPILEKISTLTQLSKLDLRKGYSDRYPSISLTLFHGLDILKPLKHLNFVGAGNNPMNDADKDWISKNWKRVKVINGRLLQNSNI